MLRFFLVIVSICILAGHQYVIAQRHYIDLTGCDTTLNSEDKDGWINGFRDRFNNPDTMQQPGNYLCYLPDADFGKLVVSDQNWHWRWTPNSKPDDIAYSYLKNITSGTDPGDPSGPSQYISLLITNEYPAGGITFGKSNRYPVTKSYSYGEIVTHPLIDCYGGIKDSGYSFIYGYAEIRCRLPAKKYGWPAFWLFSGGRGAGSGTEIDVLELGTNDLITHNMHWLDSLGNAACKGSVTFALPGQSFGGHWVTYAVKWEPNKVIWYINNEPVHIVREGIDEFLHINDDGSYYYTKAIIADMPMKVVLNNILNVEWITYNMLQDFSDPNSMDVDYIRIWRRYLDTTEIKQHPDPVFSINGTPCGGSGSNTPLEFYNTSNLILNASESYMPDHRYVIVIDSSGTELTRDTIIDGGQYLGQTVNMANFSLKDLYSGFVTEIEYKIRIKGWYDDGSGAVINPTEVCQLFTIIPFVPGTQVDYAINGIHNSDMSHRKRQYIIIV